MPLVVTVFATTPGAGTHSISDVVASIGAGWSGVPPSGAGDALLWADGFEGPGSLSEEQPASVSAATASTVAARRDSRLKYPTARAPASRVSVRRSTGMRMLGSLVSVACAWR